MVKRNTLLCKKERLLQRHELCTKGKVILRRKEEFMNFRIKEKLILQISGGKKRSFSTQEVGRKIIFP